MRPAQETRLADHTLTGSHTSQTVFFIFLLVKHGCLKNRVSTRVACTETRQRGRTGTRSVQCQGRPGDGTACMVWSPESRRMVSKGAQVRGQAWKRSPWRKSGQSYGRGCPSGGTKTLNATLWGRARRAGFPSSSWRGQRRLWKTGLKTSQRRGGGQRGGAGEAGGKVSGSGWIRRRGSRIPASGVQVRAVGSLSSLPNAPTSKYFVPGLSRRRNRATSGTSASPSTAQKTPEPPEGLRKHPV